MGKFMVIPLALIFWGLQKTERNKARRGVREAVPS